MCFSTTLATTYLHYSLNFSLSRYFITLAGLRSCRHHQATRHHDAVLADSHFMRTNSHKGRHHTRAFTYLALEDLLHQSCPLLAIGLCQVESMNQLGMMRSQRQFFRRLLAAIYSFFFHQNSNFSIRISPHSLMVATYFANSGVAECPSAVNLIPGNMSCREDCIYEPNQSLKEFVLCSHSLLFLTLFSVLHNSPHEV